MGRVTVWKGFGRAFSAVASAVVATLGTAVTDVAGQNLSLQPVATGLSAPMFVTAPANDARLFYVERGGVIKVQQTPGSTPTTFLNISSKVATDGERGLLGMAFDPNYASNGRFYVNYIDSTTLSTVVERYTVSTNANVAGTTAQNIINVAQPSGRNNHKAGWIGFRPGEASNLYVATGDGGSSDDPDKLAQSLTSNLGRSSALTSAGTARGPPRPATRSLTSRETTRSGRTGCATRTATASTVTRATSTLATSARTRARK
jgi:glucose/arabinose dehydrogenase